MPTRFIRWRSVRMVNTWLVQIRTSIFTCGPMRNKPKKPSDVRFFEDTTTKSAVWRSARMERSLPALGQIRLSTFGTCGMENLLAGPNAKGQHAIAVIPGNPLRLASTGIQGVRVWDTATGEEIAPTNLCAAYSVAASPDGKWLAIGGMDHFTQLWNAADGTLSASLEATKPPIGFLGFSTDSKYLAQTSPADGLVWIWNCETKNPELILIEAADGCTLEGVAFHPDGKRIAAGGIDYMSTGERDGAVCVWDIPSKDKLFTIDIGVNALAFDTTGKYLAGAGMDDAVYVWDADTQDTVFVLSGHQQKINTIVFDPTGSYLVSGGDDFTVRVWDVLCGRLSLFGNWTHRSSLVAFSPDGKFLFCGNGNTTCYQVEFQKLLED